MFENPRGGGQERNFSTNVPKTLDLKSSSEQLTKIIFRKLTLGAPDKRLRVCFKHTLLSMDLAQSAMCFYDSTNNDLIDARFFYLVWRVKRCGGSGAGVNGWRLF